MRNFTIDVAQQTQRPYTPSDNLFGAVFFFIIILRNNLTQTLILELCASCFQALASIIEQKLPLLRICSLNGIVLLLQGFFRVFCGPDPK